MTSWTPFPASKRPKKRSDWPYFGRVMCKTDLRIDPATIHIARSGIGLGLDVQAAQEDAAAAMEMAADGSFDISDSGHLQSPLPAATGVVRPHGQSAAPTV